MICFQLSIPDGPDVLIVNPRASTPVHLGVEVKSGTRAVVGQNQTEAGAGVYWPIVRTLDQGEALLQDMQQQAKQ